MSPMFMDTPQEYFNIVTFDNKKDFEEAVQYCLDNGWHTCGNVFMREYDFCVEMRIDKAEGDNV